MKRRFGGIIAEPQGVSSSRTTHRHMGPRSEPHHLDQSIINDSAYEKPIREVYTDTDMPVACDVIAGRDESDFYEALGPSAKDR